MPSPSISATEDCERSTQAALLAIAACGLGTALHLNDGLYSLPAVIALAASLLVATFAILAHRSTPLAERRMRILLVVLISIQLCMMLPRTAGASAATVPTVDQTPYRIAIACAWVSVLAIGFTPRRWVIAGFVTLLCVFVAGGIWKIRSAPQPRIDVFVFQQDAADALRRLENPYGLTFPNIYGGGATVYAPQTIRDGRLQFGYPYPPLVLLFTAPLQWLAGDFRYAQLLAMVLAAVCIAKIGRDRLGMLIAALMLWTPRGFYVLEMGWTEPFSGMLLAATVVLARGTVVSWLAMGLLIASKQYLPATLLLVPLLWERHIARRAALACVTAVAVTLPLALWDIAAFVHSVVTLQMHQPYRADALSLLAWWGSTRAGWTGPFWLAFAGLGIAIGAGMWRRVSFPAAFALCYFWFFALNKQAFANYYYLVIVALCAAAATVRREITNASD